MQLSLIGSEIIRADYKSDPESEHESLCRALQLPLDTDFSKVNIFDRIRELSPEIDALWREEFGE